MLEYVFVRVGLKDVSMATQKRLKGDAYIAISRVIYVYVLL